MFLVGETRVFFTLPIEASAAPCHKEKFGLNHLAFRVRSPEELRKAGAHLSACGVRHSGVQLDPYGQREFLWLDDPDAIRLEFYLRA